MRIPEGTERLAVGGADSEFVVASEERRRDVVRLSMLQKTASEQRRRRVPK